jgi:hypothetical protein
MTASGSPAAVAPLWRALTYLLDKIKKLAATQDFDELSSSRLVKSGFALYPPIGARTVPPAKTP